MKKNHLIILLIGTLFLSASSLLAENLTQEPIRPLPTKIVLNPAKVELGRQLFHDVRLSGDDTISCASCHSLTSAGVDNLVHSVGIRNQTGAVNAPTVFNSGYNFRQFWDGRAATLEEQAAGPIHNPIEMDASWARVLPKLRADADYVKAFSAHYSDGIQPKNIQDAIATFERSLITYSRFDRYLYGDTNAITEREKEGYRLFKSYGCIACHQGINIGGNLYQKLGFFGDFFADRGSITKPDLGRYNVTEQESDRHRFKVPSLRNIARTEPYFHDGSIPDLQTAVAIMARYQLGRSIPAEHVDLIITFLHALNGVDHE
ncbi:MAG: cytochrome-c peroxidase [Magnetococcales bacterium]|nr:cytochrome-c peroxidase [Magnetococcales bacterium]